MGWVGCGFFGFVFVNGLFFGCVLFWGVVRGLLYFGCFCVFSYAINFLYRPIDRASMKVVKDLEGFPLAFGCVAKPLRFRRSKK